MYPASEGASKIVKMFIDANIVTLGSAIKSHFRDQQILRLTNFPCLRNQKER